MSNVRELTASTFDEEIGASELPVLVDVWTEWCPPCKAIAPVLDALADEHGDRMQFFKLNGEDARDIVTRYDVMAFPTLLVFRDGQLASRIVGAKGKRHLLEDLREFVS